MRRSSCQPTSTCDHKAGVKPKQAGQPSRPHRCLHSFSLSIPSLSFSTSPTSLIPSKPPFPYLKAPCCLHRCGALPQRLHNRRFFRPWARHSHAPVSPPTPHSPTSPSRTGDTRRPSRQGIMTLGTCPRGTPSNRRPTWPARPVTQNLRVTARENGKTRTTARRSRSSRAFPARTIYPKTVCAAIVTLDCLPHPPPTPC